MPKLSDLVGRGSYLKHEGGCRSCPRKMVDHVPATLRDASVIAVGEAPGRQEVEEGEGFVGESGQIIRHILKDVGIKEYALSNIIHCRPPDNATPKAREVSACMRQLTMQEVEGYPVVILLGNVAMDAFFPGVGAQRLRGNFAIHPDYPGQKFFCTYHPAYVLRNRTKEGVLREHIGRVGEYLDDPSPPFTIYRATHPRFDEKFQEALAATTWSLDLETNDRLESWLVDSRIISIALTWNGEEVITVHEEDPVFTGVLEEVRKWLQVRMHKVIGFNLGFDLEWLETMLGFTTKSRHILDVKALYYQLRGYKELSLKELVSREGTGYRYLVPWPGESVDPEVLLYYNAEDTIHPWHLFKKGFPLLRPRTRDLYLRVAGPSSLTTRRITATGIHFRTEAWQRTFKEVTKDIEANLAAWQQDDPRFDPKTHTSGKGFEKYLYEVCGMPVLATTKTGRPVVDDAVIDKLIREHGADFLKHRREHQRLEKLRSTYLEPYRGLVSTDGRVHPSYLYDSTKTRRLSSRKPNFQNQPRDNQIRDMFGAPEGHGFYQVDYSQIEFRIGMSLANVTPVIEKYNEGFDIHQQTAAAVAGVALDKVTKKQRTDAKAVNFSLLYGGSAEGLQQYAAHEYGIEFPLSEAKKFCRIFFQEVAPGLEEWHQGVIQRLREGKGELELAQGHVVYYKDWDSKDASVRGHAERAAINATCQSTAADVTNYTLVLADQWMREWEMRSRIVGTVHDSAHLDTYPGEEADALDLVRQAVEEVEAWIRPWFKVPLVLDFEVGDPEPSWGQLRDL